ncbi:MAG TPA: SoxR reducing system RseC family protein [Firmicutes bacterium]|jgi:sigma-E factor negative regulatory protein RseC|nr:SoxR reducing system RseC family protein [Bacillota bacterium]
MEQVGLVVEVKDDKAIVAIRRHDVCAKCGGCGVAVSGKGETHLEALNQANAAVGQTVRVVSDTAQVLKASFMVYIVPMLALLIGLYAGQQLGPSAGIPRLDIVLGVVFLFVSYLLIRKYDRKVASQRATSAVVEILPGPYDGPADEKC